VDCRATLHTSNAKSHDSHGVSEKPVLGHCSFVHGRILITFFKYNQVRLYQGYHYKWYNHTTVLASHLLDEVLKVCVVVLRKGEKLYSGRVDEMISSHDGVFNHLGYNSFAFQDVLKNQHQIDAWLGQHQNLGSLLLLPPAENTTALLYSDAELRVGSVLTSAWVRTITAPTTARFSIYARGVPTR